MVLSLYNVKQASGSRMQRLRHTLSPDQQTTLKIFLFIKDAEKERKQTKIFENIESASMLAFLNLFLFSCREL